MINLKIAELRKRNGMTQQELGDILSASYKTISKWENGTCLPDINTLPELSKIFNVSVEHCWDWCPWTAAITDRQIQGSQITGKIEWNISRERERRC